MIKNYVKKSNVLKAVKFTGDNIDECYEFIGEKNPGGVADRIKFRCGFCRIGDYITLDDEGNFMPANGEAFEQKYMEI